MPEPFLNVFVVNEDEVYVSPNADVLPPPPIVSRHVHSVFTGLKTRWGYDEYFYLAFVPEKPSYHGPVFGCLNKGAVCLERLESRNGVEFGIIRELQKEWTALDNIVYNVQTLIMQRLTEHLFPLDICLTTPPYRIPFFKSHPTSHKAIVVANATRAAFTLNLAFMSFTLMLLQDAGVSDYWTELAASKTVPQSICDAFRALGVDDWTIPRVGAFIDAAKLHVPEASVSWINYVKLILKLDANVPIWIFYGRDGRVARQRVQEHIAKSFIPSQEAVAKAMEVARLARQSESQALWQDALQDPNDQVPVQSAIIGNDTPDGKSFDEYMTSVEQIRTHVMSTETVKEREAREAREEAQLMQPAPPRGGPAVYLWSVENDRWSRQFVDGKRITRLWTNTNSSQRHYNSIRNEYDVLETTNPTNPSGATDSDELNNDDQMAANANVHLYDPFTTAHVYPKHPLQLDVPVATSFHQLVGDTSYVIHSDRIQVDSVRMALTTRYGVLSGMTAQGIQKKEAVAWIEKPTGLYRIIGHWSKLDSLTTEDLPSVAEFVAYTMDRELPPPHICDLSVRPGITTPSSLSAGFYVTPYITTSSTWYKLTVLNDTHTNSDWDVFVTSALTVNQCRRGSFGDTKEMLVSNLAARGIPFRTFRPSRTTETTASSLSDMDDSLKYDNAPVGLGVLPHGTTLTRDDYVAYEEIRDDVLLRQRRGRAALCRGGILWRVARESVSMDAILGGPIGDGDMLNIEFDNCVHEDDDLSAQEACMILGVYRVETAQSVKSASKSSWWPTAETWADCGMNVNYWTDQTEDWFQQRITSIQAGTATVKTADQWKKELKQNRGSTRAFLNNAETVAQQFV